ncbi:MAG: glycosyltransferase [Chthoniobacterales bacterium]
MPADPLLRTLSIVDSNTYLRAYTTVHDVRRVNPANLEFDAEGLAEHGWDKWRDNRALPVRTPEGYAIAAVDPARLPVSFRRTGRVPFLLLEEEWVDCVTRFCGQEFLHEAVHGLATAHPASSAKRTFTPPQLGVVWAGLTAVLGGLLVAPVATLIVVNCILNLFYTLCVGFKTLLVFIGSTRTVSHKVSPQELDGIDPATLPVYSILVPVFREPLVVSGLVRQLSSLNYPLAKLDVNILLEEGDDETIEAVRAIRPPPNFHTIVVPHAEPKTKPKACNYGMFFVSGKYTAIYDAEDFPEPDQLEKVVVSFRKLPAKVVCIQGCLNYFNWRENLLTRLFTLEYTSWFDYNLPGMEAMKIPIPLGGTSNHFKTDRLRELGAWDPYNVTEDADLGVRASTRGYTVATIDSTTFEEANCHVGNWVRQRSRWIKGYMQTFLVHTRHPFRLARRIGWRGFVGFVLFIGGTPFTFLVNPILWLILVVWAVTRSPLIDEIFPPWLLALSIANLVLGNLLAVYACVLAVFRRGRHALSPYALLNPFYWVLHAVAAYKGLWQLVVNPFYWEKTDHGLTAVTGGLPSVAHSRDDA